MAGIAIIKGLPMLKTYANIINCCITSMIWFEGLYQEPIIPDYKNGYFHFCNQEFFYVFLNDDERHHY